MIPQPPARRAPHQGNPYTQHAPNAALLIDFDNVTMGIRSDLGKELKSLLNSDVIRGKVAVQRAYADWRRYPQYIVPLAESSIDLIFAPAYGSSKKNATDLRMAIDAIELVFTRPEIGTFILMTGDSDFSSCVLKLKEYGKYVIGVGMRESSSDLLIQNCDEYYSYHALSGLTRADEVTESREDPWVLVKRAVQQMAANGDVMRTDRLKQVMLELDPAFDEKEIGYNKFSRFVHEAATKGVIRLRKGENGQYEIVSEDGEAPRPAERRPREPVESTDGRRRRGRERDEPRRDAPRPEAPRPEPIATASAETPAEPDEAAATAAPAAIAATTAPAATAPTTAPAAPAAEAAPVEGLPAAYGLLQQALQQLGGTGGKSVRDGDVKRRMLELAPGFDETALGFGKFTRFLRQAHDAEAIDLQRLNGGNYEVSLPASGKRFAAPVPSRAPEAAPLAATAAASSAPSPPAAEPAATSIASATPASPAETPATRAGVGALRGRKPGRGAALEGPPPILPGQVLQVSTPPAQEPGVPEAEPAEAAAPAVEPMDTAAPPADAVAPESAAAEEEAPPKKARSRRGRRGRGGERAADAEEAAAEDTPTEVAETPVEAPQAEAPAPEIAAPAAEPAAPRAGLSARTRTGRRGGRDSTEGPPPILPGQSVAPPVVHAEPEPVAEPVAAGETVAEAPEGAPAAEQPAKKRRRTRGGRGRKGTATEVAAESAEEARFSAPELGLPTDRDATLTYLSTAYKGVGRKSAESLVDAFEDDVFRVLTEEPEKVTGVLGDRRAGALLASWNEDLERRREAAEPTAAEATPAAAVDESSEEESGAGEEQARSRSRTRRGGRGRPRKRTEPAPGS